MLEEWAARVTDMTGRILTNEMTRLKLVANKLPLLFSAVKTNENMRIQRLATALAGKSTLRIEQEKGRVDMLDRQLVLYAPVLLRNHQKHIELMESKLQSAHPDRILRLGFSITRIGGKAVKDASDVQEGDEIETTLAAGTIRSRVESKN